MCAPLPLPPAVPPHQPAVRQPTNLLTPAIAPSPPSRRSNGLGGVSGLAVRGCHQRPLQHRVDRHRQYVRREHRTGGACPPSLPPSPRLSAPPPAASTAEGAPVCCVEGGARPGRCYLPASLTHLLCAPCGLCICLPCLPNTHTWLGGCGSGGAGAPPFLPIPPLKRARGGLGALQYGGGAIYAQPGTALTVTGSTFDANTAGSVRAPHLASAPSLVRTTPRVAPAPSRLLRCRGRAYVCCVAELGPGP